MTHFGGFLRGSNRGRPHSKGAQRTQAPALPAPASVPVPPPPLYPPPPHALPLGLVSLPLLGALSPLPDIPQLLQTCAHLGYQQQQHQRLIQMPSQRCKHLLYRIIELFRLERSFKIIEPNRKPNTASPPLNQVPKRHIYTSLKSLQGWRLSRCPGQPVPVLGNPFGEGIFPDSQSKPPLAQLEAISSRPIPCPSASFSRD